LIQDGMHPRLAAALQPLESLIDWERRDRSAGTGMRIDLGPSLDLHERLGRPSAAFRAVHVTGTKGKGSTVALVEAGLRAAGYRVGAYLSPHVERVNERVRIDGSSVSDAPLAAALERAWRAREEACAAGSAARDATWFDVFTNAAFDVLREASVEWAVVEVGIGGRLDSTNVLQAEACVITNVSLEHTAMLGATRSAIAREKAGILKAGAIAVTGLAPGGAPWNDAAGAVVEAAASGLGCALLRPRWDYVREDADVDVSTESSTVSRTGSSSVSSSEASEPATPSTETNGWVPCGSGLDHAAQNAALAGLVLDALGERGLSMPSGQTVGAWLLDERVRAAARLPARAERFVCGELSVVIDGAHVPASLSGLLDDLAAESSLVGKPVVVIGMGRDKDAPGLLKALVGRVDRVLCTSVGDGPYLPAADLARIGALMSLRVETVATPQEALERALTVAPRGGWVLVTGSLHLAGAVRPLITRAPPC
jgi:dihydrofolate synthase/folylpolyglutamate synthase